MTSLPPMGLWTDEQRDQAGLSRILRPRRHRQPAPEGAPRPAGSDVDIAYQIGRCIGWAAAGAIILLVLWIFIPALMVLAP